MAIDEYNGVLESGGCLPDSGFEEACTTVQELDPKDLEELNDFIIEFQEERREHLPRDIDELKNLVRYIDAETAKLKVI